MRITASSARAITLCLMSVFGCVGCAVTRERSTRLTTEDVKEMAEQMASSMASSDFLRERSPESERMVVALDHVENLSSDVVPVSEQCTSWSGYELQRRSPPLERSETSPS